MERGSSFTEWFWNNRIFVCKNKPLSLPCIIYDKLILIFWNFYCVMLLTIPYSLVFGVVFIHSFIHCLRRTPRALCNLCSPYYPPPGSPIHELSSFTHPLGSPFCKSDVQYSVPGHPKAETRGQPGWVLVWILRRKTHFQAHSRHWQHLIPCDHKHRPHFLAGCKLGQFLVPKVHPYSLPHGPPHLQATNVESLTCYTDQPEKTPHFKGLI